MLHLRHPIVHYSILSQVAYFKNGTIGQDNRKHALTALFPKLTLLTATSDPCRDQKEFFAVEVSRWGFCCSVSRALSHV